MTCADFDLVEPAKQLSVHGKYYFAMLHEKPDQHLGIYYVSRGENAAIGENAAEDAPLVLVEWRSSRVSRTSVLCCVVLCCVVLCCPASFHALLFTFT